MHIHKKRVTVDDRAFIDRDIVHYTDRVIEKKTTDQTEFMSDEILGSLAKFTSRGEMTDAVNHGLALFDFI